MSWDIRCVVACGCQVGEGPVWDVDAQRLLWVDILGKAIHAYFPDDERTQKWLLDEMVGFCLPCKDGRWVVGLQSGLALARLKDDGRVELEHMDRPEPNLAENRFNDGACDSAGRLWCGTMHMPGTSPLGKLLCYDRSRSARVMDEGYVVTNGPALSLDSRTLYHCETAENAPQAQGIYAFDLDRHGNLSNKRLLLDYRARAGMPDGLMVDAEGRLWVGEWGGARLTCFDSSGRLLCEVPMPTTNVTKAAFGGANLDVLYVTTAAAFLSEEAMADEPNAGGLFAIAGIGKGLPPFRFDNGFLQSRWRDA